MFTQRSLQGRKFFNLRPYYTSKRNAQEASETKSMYNLQTFFSPQRAKQPQKEPLVKSLCLGKLDKEFLDLHNVQTHDRYREFKSWLKPIEEYVDICAHNDNKLNKTEVLNNLRDLEVFRACVTEEINGFNLMETELLQLIETVSKIPWLGTYLVKNHIVPLKLINKYGSHSQKAEYYLRIMSGEITPNVCIHEGESGTNMNNIKCSIVECEKDTWILNGTKTFVINGIDSNLFLVFAKHITGTTALIPTFSLVLVEADNKSITVKNVHDAVSNHQMPICTVNFNEAEVPRKNFIGDPGSALKILLETMVPGNQHTSGQAISLLKNFMNQLTMDVLEMKHFDREFYKFDAVKKILGDMAISLYAMESMAYFTSSLSDLFEDQDVELEKIITEVYCTNECLKHIQAGLQLVGAQSYLNKSSYIQAFHNALNLLTIDLNNIDANVYIASMAVQYTGSYVHQDIHNLRNPALYPFVAWKHFLNRTKNQKLDFSDTLHPSLHYGGVFLGESIKKLNESVKDLFVSYGAQIIEKQMEHYRLTEMLTQMYLSIAALSRSSRSSKIGLGNSEPEHVVASSISFLANTKLKRLAEDIENGDQVNGDYVRKCITDLTYEKHKYPLRHPLGRTF